MTDIELKDGERVNQLFSSDVKIIQNREVFSYSVDSVLLSRFSKIAQARIDRWISALEMESVGLFASTRTEAQIHWCRNSGTFGGYGYPLDCPQWLEPANIHDHR